MSFSVNPCDHLRDLMTVTVENVRGGENIQVPLFLNLAINIQSKPNESVNVSGGLDLENYCTTRRDNFIYEVLSDSNGDLSDINKFQESSSKMDRKYYTSGELTAYIVVGVLSSLLLVTMTMGVLWYLNRKRRKKEKHYSLTMRKSARRIESWTRKDSVNTTVEDWHQRNTLQSTVSHPVSHPAFSDDTFFDTPLPSIVLDQQVLFSPEM